MRHPHTDMSRAGTGRRTVPRGLVTWGWAMRWQAAAVREASRNGDYGKVIELVRQDRRMTQAQLGGAIGLSQSAVSRLEKRGPRTYGTDVLAAAAAHLGIPPALVGLADSRPQGRVNGDDDVDRRQFLGGVAATAATPVLGGLPDKAGPGGGQAAALRLSTSAYRRLDGSTPSRDLSEAVKSHMRLIQTVTGAATADGDRTRLAAVGSEAASLAGWLAWDMGDHGSARAWYGSAVKAARSSGDPLLTAYQIGSLAQFEAHAGNGTEALNLTGRARRVLGERRPPVAEAWLLSVEALAHAAEGDHRSADGALTASRAAAETLPEDPPPWPWVFTFDPAKVAACRVSCGARLGLADWVLSDDVEALTTGHAKQRALLILDIAAGHLAGGRVESAFALAGRALDAGLAYKSGRVVERARAVRRTFTTTAPSKVVRDFDERLHGIYL
ncbi:helix-turn-helix domain-containing protein [Streptomyces sp. JW3]|uniref:helix-turn-helix domain-containing protein n=1 Tax=Streptomyces sp. JW3 TaxID=3456955 RepID=UPI003FA40995